MNTISTTYKEASVKYLRLIAIAFAAAYVVELLSIVS